jgi:hypothetical protein
LVERQDGQDEVDWAKVLGDHWAKERGLEGVSCEKFMPENLMVEEGWCWGGLGENPVMLPGAGGAGGAIEALSS